jgi:hypothetical protein
MSQDAFDESTPLPPPEPPKAARSTARGRPVTASGLRPPAAPPPVPPPTKVTANNPLLARPVEDHDALLPEMPPPRASGLARAQAPSGSGIRLPAPSLGSGSSPRPEAALSESLDDLAESEEDLKSAMSMPGAPALGGSSPALFSLSSDSSPPGASPLQSAPLSPALSAKELRQLASPGESGNAVRAITPSVPLSVNEGIRMRAGALAVLALALLVVGVALGVLIVKYAL